MSWQISVKAIYRPKDAIKWAETLISLRSELSLSTRPSLGHRGHWKKATVYFVIRQTLFAAFEVVTFQTYPAPRNFIIKTPKANFYLPKTLIQITFSILASLFSLMHRYVQHRTVLVMVNMDVLIQNHFLAIQKPFDFHLAGGHQAGQKESLVFC